MEASGVEVDVETFGYDTGDDIGTPPGGPPPRQRETTPVPSADSRGSTSVAFTPSLNQVPAGTDMFTFGTGVGTATAASALISDPDQPEEPAVRKQSWGRESSGQANPVRGPAQQESSHSMNPYTTFYGTEQFGFGKPTSSLALGPIASIDPRQSSRQIVESSSVHGVKQAPVLDSSAWAYPSVRQSGPRQPDVLDKLFPELQDEPPRQRDVLDHLFPEFQDTHVGSLDPMLARASWNELSPRPSGFEDISAFPGYGQTSASHPMVDQMSSRPYSAYARGITQPADSSKDMSSMPREIHGFGTDASTYPAMANVTPSSQTTEAEEGRYNWVTDPVEPMRLPMQGAPEGPLLHGDADANQYVLEDEEPSSDEEQPPPLSASQQDLLRPYRDLPGGAHLARKLFNRPDWLGPDEVVTKLHNCQVVPVDWLPEEFLKHRKLLNSLHTDRYVKGMTIANNAMLRAPLIGESSKAYKIRQIKVVRRVKDNPAVLGLEYTL